MIASTEQEFRSITQSKNLININTVRGQNPDESQDGFNQSPSQVESVQSEVTQAEEDVTTFRFVGQLLPYLCMRAPGLTPTSTVQQYDGTLTFRPKIESDKEEGVSIDLAGTCQSYQMVYPLQSDSFHVVRYEDNFKLVVDLLQLILPDEGVTCAIVESSTEITILNGVGLSKNNPTESRVIAQLSKDKQNAEKLAQFTRCVDKPCNKEVDAPDSDGSTTQFPASTVSVQLKAGIPNVVFSNSAQHPYSKRITISGEGAVPHIMHVVVTGLFPTLVLVK